MKTKVLIGILALTFTTFSSVYAQRNPQVTLTEQDHKARLEYRYKVTVYTPEWNESKEAYETQKKVYYAQHWELDESKKYSSLEQNHLDGSTTYLTEKSHRLKMPNAAHFDEKGELSKCDCSYSLGGDFYYKIIIVDLNNSRIVWRNYDWELF